MDIRNTAYEEHCPKLSLHKHIYILCLCIYKFDIIYSYNMLHLIGITINFRFPTSTAVRCVKVYLYVMQIAICGPVMTFVSPEFLASTARPSPLFVVKYDIPASPILL